MHGRLPQIDADVGSIDHGLCAVAKVGAFVNEKENGDPDHERSDETGAGDPPEKSRARLAQDHYAKNRENQQARDTAEVASATSS